MFNWWRRWQACKMAALAMQGSDVEAIMPTMWSLAVFFENYMRDGATATHEDFGLKEAVELIVVKDTK